METASMYGVGALRIFFAAKTKTIPARTAPTQREKILRHAGIAANDATTRSPSVPVNNAKMECVANWKHDATAAEITPAKTA